MHKLNLTDTTQTTNSMPEPIVDEVVLGDDNQQPSLVNDSGATVKKSVRKMVLGLSVFAVFAGIATGYGTHKLTARGNSETSMGGNKEISKIAGDNVSAGDVFGSANTELFKDSAEGYLEAGGINGEGSHKLLRPGGDSQTVYLTSSVTDLDKLVGMEVKIWGETFKAQRAGWLMDVGRVEIVTVAGTSPSEE